MLDQDIITRISRVSSCYILHAAVKQARVGIERSIMMSGATREPVNVLLTGGAGVGKSMTCQAISSRRKPYQAKRDGYDVTIVPAFYTSVPSPVTVKGIASSMLRSLGDSSPTQGSALEMTERLSSQLTKCETDVIMLDELQHLLKLDLGKKDDVKNWLKGLIDECKKPVIVVGAPECESIINSDPQIARRFTRRFRLKNLNFGGKKKGEYRKFVETLSKVYKKKIELKELPYFSSRSSCLQIYAASGGNPSDTASILIESITLSLEDGRECVTGSDLINAYSSLELPNSLLTNQNPFKLSLKELNTALAAGNVRGKGA